MKIQSSVALALVALTATASAFCPQKQAFNKHTSLEAKKDWWSPLTAAAVGWTLASQIASASMLPTTEQLSTHQEAGTPTLLLSVAGGKVSEWFKEEEKTYEKIDFSMPSYDTKSIGFGDGSQGQVTEKKGISTEADLQAQAMKKAEAARQARLQEKREAMKAREAEDRARAEAKTAEGKERVSALFQ
jgi:hypothetical protein